MKKFLAVLMVLAMCLSVLAVTGYAAESTVTVYAYVPDSWTSAYLYYWQGGTAWPGAQMTKGSDGWYYGQIPASGVEGVIVNNGKGSQTADIKGDALPSGKDFWIVVSSDNSYSVSTTKPVNTNTEAKMRDVYAKVPSEWSNANIYTWGSNGNFAPWPGSAMTKGSDGWYHAEVPATYGSIIINNGSAQTADLILTADQMAADALWIDLSNSLSKPSITTSKPSDDSQPEEEPFVINVVGLRGNPEKLPALNWESDLEMTKTASTGYGVYEYTFENVPGESWPELKFTTNNGWDLNFGCVDENVGATSGTAHQAVHNGANIWFEVKVESRVHVKLDLSQFDPADNSGAVYTITITPANGEDDATGTTDTVTVHAQVPADWTDVAVYVWDPNGTYDVAWPGAVMTKGSDGWYTAEIPAWAANVIINNNGNGAQTQDMSVTTGHDLWIVVEATEGGFTGTVSYESPKTGDVTNLLALSATMFLAAAGLVFTVSKKKEF